MYANSRMERPINTGIAASKRRTMYLPIGAF
jgi:hypothetical protein